MIVRNGAATLKACLESVAPLCDEMLVVDTGSEDDSPAIARSFGATVIHSPWVRDFSAARNVYVERARCRWVFSLDADEFLGDTRKIDWMRLLKDHPATAFVFQIRNYFFQHDFPQPALPSRLRGGAPPGMGCLISRTVRLFPRLRGVQYCYPVHESLIPAIEREGIRVRHCGMPIHHIGALCQKAEVPARAALYRELGQRKIAEFPDHFQGYLELGQLYFQERDHDGAERLFRDCIRLRPVCVEAHCFLALTLLRQGRRSACRELMRLMRTRFPHSRDARYLVDTLDRQMQAGA